jgi:hypothetical protein
VRRHAVDPLDGLRVAADRERHPRTHDGQGISVDVVDRVAGAAIVGVEGDPRFAARATQLIFYSSTLTRSVGTNQMPSRSRVTEPAGSARKLPAPVTPLSWSVPDTTRRAAVATAVLEGTVVQ